MVKIIYLIMLVIAISSCGVEGVNENSLANIEKVKNLTATIQTEFLKNGSYYANYFSLDIQELDSETFFIYRRDSTYATRDSIMNIDSIPDYTMTLRINKSNDTLYLDDVTIKSPHLNENIKQVLMDSVNVSLKNKTLKLYIYKRVSDDKRWDEVSYFSKEYGIIYSYYNYFNAEKSLVQHSNIKTNDLKELITQLRSKHKEVTIQ